MIPRQIADEPDVTAVAEVGPNDYVTLRRTNGYQPWVTHRARIMTDGTVEYNWGHYHGADMEGFVDALADFTSRVSEAFGDWANE